VSVKEEPCNRSLFPPQTLQKEIQGHQPRYDDIFERSQHVLREGSATAEPIRQRLAEFQSLWEKIKKETEKRHARLSEAHEAQQYYFDAAEAEAWMSEQELYMMSEEKAKVRRGGQIIKHVPAHLKGNCPQILMNLPSAAGGTDHSRRSRHRVDEDNGGFTFLGLTGDPDGHR